MNKQKHSTHFDGRKNMSQFNEILLELLVISCQASAYYYNLIKKCRRQWRVCCCSFCGQKNSWFPFQIKQNYDSINTRNWNLFWRLSINRSIHPSIPLNCLGTINLSSRNTNVLNTEKQAIQIKNENRKYFWQKGFFLHGSISWIILKKNIDL